MTAQAGRGAAFGRAALRRIPFLGTVLGLALGVWLVAANDLASVTAAFGRIGLVGLLGVVLVRVLVVGLCGLAWARLLNAIAQAPTGAFLLLRFVREGINTLLPVASVGGDVVGGRLLTFWGVAGGFAAASILVDMLLQVGTQAAFASLGVVLLGRVEGATAAALSDWALRALVVAGIVLVAFFALQRSGAAGFAERRLAGLGRRFVREADAGNAAGPSVQAALDAVWARGRFGRLAQSALLHLCAWLLGAAEIWIVLACMGVPGIGLAEVVVIEALSQAIKSAAFPIPSGLGVQEGGFILLGGLFGIDAGTALALSLAKRVPDVALGLPALFAWQAIEARRGGVAGMAR